MTKTELEKTHPDYDAFLPEWLFFVRSYFGGKRYRDGNYLLQHPFESDANYKRRKNQTFFYNYCQPIVDIFVSLLFKKDPSRDFGTLKDNILFDSFLTDADLEGNSYAQFIREAQRYAAVYGRVSIMVDKPALPALTQQEAQDKGIRPYLTLITPENIIDWQYVRLANGQPALAWIKVVEGRDVNGAPSVIRVWDTGGWALYIVDKNAKKDVEITPIAEGVHALGVVPIVNLYNKNSGTRMIGISDIEDIAAINRHIFYLCSDAQEIVENTAFPMLAQAWEKGNTETTSVGPKNIIQFDPDSNNSKPFWLEAPHSSLTEIRELIAQDVASIYKMANLLGIYSTGQGVQPMAGIAMEIENQQRDAALAEKSDNMEQSEKQILNLYARWEGKQFDGTVNYLNDFSLSDTDKSIVNITNFLISGAVQTPLFWQELMKKQTKNLLGDIPKERRYLVYREIESTTTVPDMGAGATPAAMP